MYIHVYRLLGNIVLVHTVGFLSYVLTHIVNSLTT